MALKNQIHNQLEDIKHTWSVLYEQFLQNGVNTALLFFHTFLHHWGKFFDRLFISISVLAAVGCIGSVLWQIGFGRRRRAGFLRTNE